MVMVVLKSKHRKLEMFSSIFWTDELLPFSDKLTTTDELLPFRQIHNRRSSSELKRDDPELFPDSHIAPSLRPASRQLQHELKKNKLNQLLQSRPTPTELVDAGIVKPQISSRIKGVAKVLEHKQRTDKLGHLLEQRYTIYMLT